MKRAALVPLRAFAGVALLALGVVGATSCGGNDDVTIVLLDPCAESGGTSFKDASIYTEILVVENGCPSDDDLAAGDVKGVVHSTIAPSDSPSLPEIGALEEGSYGFVVLVKDANCGVIGFGCTAADLEKIREVRIAVRAWTNSSNTCQPLSGGSCPAPKTCEEGRCVGESTSDGGGGGCDLSVVKAGKLPAPAVTGAELTGPGIVSTSTGFVVGYREYSSDGAIKATLIPLSDAGTLGAPTRVDVASCAGKSLNDGVGMAYKGTGGLMVMSLPDCADGNGAGAAFLPFGADGAVGSWSAPHNPGFSDLTLARAHSLAPATKSNEWEFVYRAVSGVTGSVQRAIIQGNAFKSGAPIDFLFGSADASFVQVATGTSARALVGGGIATEGGSGSKVEFSKIEPTSGDTHTPVGEIPLGSGNWATLTAWGDRVVSAAPGASALSWSATEVTTAGIAPLESDASIGSGTIAGADVVAHGDSLLFALAKASEISVHRLSGAEGALSTTASATETLSGTVGNVSLASFDGTRVAIAAGRSRAAVVWITSKTAEDPVGGYAVLQCAK